MNVPKLRFSEFEGEWDEKQLSHYMTFKNGVNADKSMYGHGRKFINVMDIIAERPIVSENIIGSVSISDAEFKKNEVAYGDILFQRSSETREETGQSNVYLDQERSATFGGFVIRGRPVVDLDPRYFDALLKTDKARKDITNRSGGSTRFNVGQASLGAVVVDVAPTLPEQKKIAAFLGVVDAKIAALRARRDGLERYKRGLVQALFSQTLRFTKPDGTAFPDWEEKRLGKVFGWARTNSLSRENLNYDGGVVQNIHYGDIHTKFRATFRQSQELVPFVSASAMPNGFKDEEFCKIGDVVIADASEDYADIGKAIEIVELTETPLVAGLHTYIARPKAGLAIGYSGYMLRSAAVRRQIMEIAQGISVLGISKTNLEKLTLQLPHPDEQQKIADALSAMDAKVAAVADQVAQMEAFKKGLLQQMFV